MRVVISCLFVLSFSCYDPKLGSSPFICGPAPGFNCPDGYACDHPGVINKCIKVGAMDTSDAPPAPVISHDGGDESDAGHVGYPCNQGLPQDSDIEPNDSPTQADQGKSHLGSAQLCQPPGGNPCPNPYGRYNNFQICPHDADYIGMDLAASDHLQITVEFHEVVGDLDAAIVDAAGHFLVIASGTGDNETLDFVAPAAGRYYLLIEGVQGQTNTYNLVFTKL